MLAEGSEGEKAGWKEELAGRKDGCLDEWIDGSRCGWMVEAGREGGRRHSRQMAVWLIGWMDGWMDGNVS